jgi:pimeloyl-[acyl-carrier protein] methyl ester esterase
MIAGWAQPESALRPLAEKIFPDAFTVTPDREGDAQRLGVGVESPVKLTSVSALLSASENECGPSGSNVPSTYAAALTSQLARRKYPSILIGWSMGGMVALETAIHYPELVRRLVLISSCAKFEPPSPDSPETQSLPAQSSQVQSSPVRAFIQELHRDRHETLRIFFSLVHSENLSAPQRTEGLHQALQMDLEHLLHGLEYIQSVDLSPRLSEVRVPTLVIHGRKDQVISWQASRLLKAGISGSELRLLDEADHGLVATSPEIMAPEIVRFLSADRLRV